MLFTKCFCLGFQIIFEDIGGDRNLNQNDEQLFVL